MIDAIGWLLELLNSRSQVEVVTDSVYVAKASLEWMPNWKANNWRRLDVLLSQHEVRFTVVRGHTGHPENERCDELAVEAALKYADA